LASTRDVTGGGCRFDDGMLSNSESNNVCFVSGFAFSVTVVSSSSSSGSVTADSCLETCSARLLASATGSSSSLPTFALSSAVEPSKRGYFKAINRRTASAEMLSQLLSQC
jgi:hypothetical protein